MTPLRNVSAPAPAAAPGATDPAVPREKLTKLAQQLEGVFLNQLFQAMRQSVPQDGPLAQAPGQELFTQMFDERMANEAARGMSRGLTDALVRQLVAKMGTNPGSEAR